MTFEDFLTSPPTQYTLSGTVLQVKRPNQHYQSTEGKEENREKATNRKYSYTINRSRKIQDFPGGVGTLYIIVSKARHPCESLN